MNIYLDIDGVLLASESYSSRHADEFIKYVVEKYPDTTYWLTTHVWKGQNLAIENLGPTLKPETRKYLEQIKPTEWGELKTDAIDFSQDFRWLDDDLWPDELKELEKNNATGSFIMVDLNKDPDFLKKPYWRTIISI